MTEATGGKVVVDTNILIYCFDKSAPAKHERAIAVVEELLTQSRLLISAQILNEFCWNVTSPRRHWAAAREHNVPVIYTEDLQHNRDVEGVPLSTRLLRDRGTNRN